MNRSLASNNVFYETLHASDEQFCTLSTVQFLEKPVLYSCCIAEINHAKFKAIKSKSLPYEIPIVNSSGKSRSEQLKYRCRNSTLIFQLVWLISMYSVYPSFLLVNGEHVCDTRRRSWNVTSLCRIEFKPFKGFIFCLHDIWTLDHSLNSMDLLFPFDFSFCLTNS